MTTSAASSFAETRGKYREGLADLYLSLSLYLSVSLTCAHTCRLVGAEVVVQDDPPLALGGVLALVVELQAGH